jgi:hypothetical protein
MRVQGQFGNLVVRSFAVDAAGNEVESISRGSNSIPTRHVVEVENWSTIPYDVSVDAELPQGRSRLSFDGPAANWNATIWSLAQSDTDRDETGLTANGNAGGNERIHCAAVKWKKAKRHRWTGATSGLPLSLTIRVT